MAPRIIGKLDSLPAGTLMLGGKVLVVAVLIR